MAIKEISSAYEVKVSVSEEELGTCNLKNLALHQRTYLVDQYGDEFYKYIISKIEDYKDAPKWSPGSYEKDTVVVYDNTAYKAKQTTTQEPTVNPEDSHWDLAPKFSESCLEKLWCDNYLRIAIGYASLIPNLPNIRTQITKKGFISMRDEHAQRVSNADYESRFSTEKKVLHDYTEWIKEYMVSYDEENDTKCFESYTKSINKKVCCETEEEEIYNDETPWVL